MPFGKSPTPHFEGATYNAIEKVKKGFVKQQSIEQNINDMYYFEWCFKSTNT
jgi:hypothetical protein